MRKELVNELKRMITEKLAHYLRGEGIELVAAQNDNYTLVGEIGVCLDAIHSTALSENMLLAEIQVILSILGKPWKCEALIRGLYEYLQPYQLTTPEVTALLMSLHIETVERMRPACVRQRTVMRYIFEEEDAC